MDYYSVYKAVKEKAENTPDEVLVKSPAYKTLATAFPHVAKAIRLKAKLRELKANRSKTTRLSERWQVEREITRAERELKRELLLQRANLNNLQWRSRS